MYRRSCYGVCSKPAKAVKRAKSTPEPPIHLEWKSSFVGNNGQPLRVAISRAYRTSPTFSLEIPLWPWPSFP